MILESKVIFSGDHIPRITPFIPTVDEKAIYWMISSSLEKIEKIKHETIALVMGSYY